MKLLFDENLSPQLAETLADIYPGSAHVHQCGLGRLRVGNCASAEIESVLHMARSTITRFVQQDPESFLVLESRS